MGEGRREEGQKKKRAQAGSKEPRKEALLASPHGEESGRGLSLKGIGRTFTLLASPLET